MRTTTALSTATVLSIVLAGCSGGSSSAPKASSSTTTAPSISMTHALASDAEATRVCKTLLGDGKQLATWADLPGATYRVSGSRGVSGEMSEHSINCAVTDTAESGNEAHLKLFGAGSSEYFTHEVDEGGSHEGAEVVAAQNSSQGTAVLTQDITALNKTPATQQIQRMAERLTR